MAVPRALSQLEHAIYQKQTQTLKVIVDGANDRIRAADGKSAITLIGVTLRTAAQTQRRWASATYLGAASSQGGIVVLIIGL